MARPRLRFPWCQDGRQTIDAACTGLVCNEPAAFQNEELRVIPIRSERIGQKSAQSFLPSPYLIFPPFFFRRRESSPARHIIYVGMQPIESAHPPLSTRSYLQGSQLPAAVREQHRLAAIKGAIASG